jgi:geranylgeranyl diphosphate synthase, type III
MRSSKQDVSITNRAADMMLPNTEEYDMDFRPTKLNGGLLQTTDTSVSDGAGRHKRNRSSLDGTKHKDGQWSEENERILIGPYDYMQQHPGKDIRRQLIHAFNAWLKVPPESLAIINKVVAMLHTASLL